MMSKFHYYYNLNFNSFPILISLSLFNLMFSFTMFLKFSNFELFILNCLNVSLSSFMWWILYSGEFNLEGKSSFSLEQGLKYSMLLFISSEIFFFFSFFWSYFDFFLSPSMEVGMNWPPYLITSFDHLNVPLVNTFILLTSGLTVTVSHFFLNTGKSIYTKLMLFFTILLGLIFSILQGMEYSSSFFNISDSTFGTTFFVLTGFHGLHVLIGTFFLFVVLYRFFKIIASKNQSLSFELASWYWHFVDVVWIFLYFVLYYLNN